MSSGGRNKRSLERRLGVAVAMGILASGCGARSGLESPAPEPPAPIEVDAGFDGGFDAGFDAGVDAGPPECVTDADCDDRVSCSVDRCVGGRCRIQADHAACDDGVFCNGAERCDVTVGCVPGEPVMCRDAQACTEDVCDPALDRCVSTPRASLCPISHRCDPMLGCVARALVNSETELFEIDLPSGELHPLGSTGHSLTDVALHVDGLLYGATPGALLRVDYEAGTTSHVVSVPGHFVSLDAGPDGFLYGAVDRRVVRLDPRRGTTVDVATFPGGLRASGDLAFVEGRMFATTMGGRGGDWLVEVHLDGRIPSIVGVMGVDCVWALAPFGGTLYGMTCDGRLLEVSTRDGSCREITRYPGRRFFGAAAR